MPFLPVLDARQYSAGAPTPSATTGSGASPSGAAAGGSGKAPNPLTILRNMQNDQFPLNLWLILLVVLSIFTLVHATISGARRLRMYRILHTQLDTPKEELEARRASAHTRSSLARLPLAALNAWRIIMFRWTLPFTDATFADAAINLGYVGLLLLWTFIASRNASLTLWASRSAAIAACQVPLLPVLASKNNIITFFTGISHEKMTSLHRAAGRAVLLLFWLHSAGKYWSGTPLDTLKMQMGAVSLVALTLTFFLSLPPVRMYIYEVFFVSHVLLIGCFLVAGWFHTNQLKASFGPWMWAGMVTWAFDRVFRLVRAIWVSRRAKNQTTTKATVEQVSSDTIRVYLQRPMNWVAGQHVFLTLPGVSANPLEAHPFTIATIPDPPYLAPRANGGAAQLSFIIRARKGMTERLRKFAANARNTGQYETTAIVDGPYGAPPDLSLHSTAVLIAGGSGVSYAMAMLEDLIQRRRVGTSGCRRVVLVWCIRDEAHIAWIYHQLVASLGSVPDNLSLSIRIFITRPSSASKSLPLASMFTGRFEVAFGSYDKNWTVKEKTTLTSFRNVHIEQGRPRVDSIIADEARSSLGSMSVDVCGPSSLVDRVRQATRATDICGPAAVMRGMPSVTLHVEAFSM